MNYKLFILFIPIIFLSCKKDTFLKSGINAYAGVYNWESSVITEHISTTTSTINKVVDTVYQLEVTESYSFEIKKNGKLSLYVDGKLWDKAHLVDINTSSNNNITEFLFQNNKYNYEFYYRRDTIVCYDANFPAKYGGQFHTSPYNTYSFNNYFIRKQ